MGDVSLAQYKSSSFHRIRNWVSCILVWHTKPGHHVGFYISTQCDIYLFLLITLAFIAQRVGKIWMTAGTKTIVVCLLLGPRNISKKKACFQLPQILALDWYKHVPILNQLAFDWLIDTDLHITDLFQRWSLDHFSVAISFKFSMAIRLWIQSSLPKEECWNLYFSNRTQTFTKL